jgi:hypothetical protein
VRSGRVEFQKSAEPVVARTSSSKDLELLVLRHEVRSSAEPTQGLGWAGPVLDTCS